MSFQNGEYKSIFKINGKTILPPLVSLQFRWTFVDFCNVIMFRFQITDERREELKRYRAQAVELAEQLKEQREIRRQIQLLEQEAENSENSSNPPEITVVELDSVGDDMSSTFTESEPVKAPETSEPTSLRLNTSIVSSLNLESQQLSPSFSLQSSPSCGALNDSKNQSLYFSPVSARNTPDPEANGRKLIRSNSYTIETPSPLLLKLIEKDGIELPDCASEAASENTISSTPVRRAWNEPRKSSSSEKGQKSIKSTPKSSGSISTRSLLSRSNSSKKVIKSTPKTSLSKSFNENTTSKPTEQKANVLRSIYDPSSVRSPIRSSKNKLDQTSKPAANTQLTPEEKFERVLKMIEQRHNAQMQELMQRQNEEQKRMQNEFSRQQEDLMRRISLLTHNQSKSPKSHAPHGNGNCIDCCDSTDCDDAILSSSRDHNGNESVTSVESSKCQRRLVYYDDNHLVSADLNRNQIEQLPNKDAVSEKETRAATIITAYARGFLTRRLFRTARVQNIVKTIRDTLLFILDIHYESSSDRDTPADLKLKTHLIQQVRLS